MLTIYHVTGTRGVRPIWLCHELGLPVRVETIDFSPTFRATAEWRAISPAGKVPRLLKDPGELAVSLVADALEKTALGLEVVEAALARSDYLLGADFGASDIMMGFSLDLLAQLEVLDARYPALLAYLRRLRTREGFIRARAA